MEGTDIRKNASQLHLYLQAQRKWVPELYLFEMQAPQYSAKEVVLMSQGTTGLKGLAPLSATNYFAMG